MESLNLKFFSMMKFLLCERLYRMALAAVLQRKVLP